MLNKAFSTSSWHVSWKGLLMDNFRPSTSYQNYGSDSVFKQFDDVSRIWEKKYNFADLFQSIICRFLVHPKLETVQYIRQKKEKKTHVIFSTSKTFHGCAGNQFIFRWRRLFTQGLIRRTEGGVQKTVHGLQYLVYRVNIQRGDTPKKCQTRLTHSENSSRKRQKI